MKDLLVTSPLLPNLEQFEECLRDIWDRQWLTNNGEYHKRLEQALCEYLKIPFISVFTNGTLPLMIALQALGIKKGEVITTPYSFVATTHSIWWNGLVPVFADIDPTTGDIDPESIIKMITPETVAIMPVHVYGKPCRTEEIQTIADKYHLKVIYDAAHAFGVEVDGHSILTAGDLSTLSFHATKVFNTIEGGALIMKDAEMKKRVDYLKNFGFANETSVVGPGINGKMDEIRAAYGLCELKIINSAIEARHKVAIKYREGLKDIAGISYFDDMPGVKHNYSYFPIFIDEAEYGMSRDDLYIKMKESDINGRRYFYPLISSFAPYCECPSASETNLPNAVRMASQVICLPMHHQLNDDDIERVISTIRKCQCRKK